MISPEDTLYDVLNKELAELKKVNEDLVIQHKAELSDKNTQLISLEEKIKDMTTECDKFAKTKESSI